MPNPVNESLSVPVQFVLLRTACVVFWSCIEQQVAFPSVNSKIRQLFSNWLLWSDPNLFFLDTFLADNNVALPSYTLPVSLLTHVRNQRFYCFAVLYCCARALVACSLLFALSNSARGLIGFPPYLGTTALLSSRTGAAGTGAISSSHLRSHVRTGLPLAQN